MCIDEYRALELVSILPVLYVLWAWVKLNLRKKINTKQRNRSHWMRAVQGNKIRRMKKIAPPLGLPCIRPWQSLCICLPGRERKCEGPVHTHSLAKFPLHPSNSIPRTYKNGFQLIICWNGFGLFSLDPALLSEKNGSRFNMSLRKNTGSKLKLFNCIFCDNRSVYDIWLLLQRGCGSGFRILNFERVGLDHALTKLGSGTGQF